MGRKPAKPIMPWMGRTPHNLFAYLSSDCRKLRVDEEGASANFRGRPYPNHCVQSGLNGS